MATLKPELKAILDRYGIDPRDAKQVWDCRGTLVLYHKAFEVIAAKESITFDPPQMIRAERDEAVVLVVGHMDKRSEWSFGEAAPANSKNTYPYAMAEKRAKDRVIAKLVGLAQYVYSEDEADEFKTGDRNPVDDNGGAQRKDPHPSSGTASKTEGAPSLDEPRRQSWEAWVDGFKADFEPKEPAARREFWIAENANLQMLKTNCPDLYEGLCSWSKALSKKRAA